MNKETRYPPRTPIAPYKTERYQYDTVGAKGHTVVYRDVETMGDSDIDLEQYFADMDEVLPQPEKGYNRITLQDIVDAAPPGAKLSDIRLHVSYPRMGEYLDVRFVHQERDLAEEERVFQLDLEKYNKEYLEYEAEMVQYEADLVSFEEWRRAEKVKELESQLNALKK